MAVFKNELQLDTASFQASLKKVAADGKATAAQLNDSFKNVTIEPKVEIDPKQIAGQVQSSFKDAFAGGILGGVVAQAGQLITQGLSEAVAAGSNFETALQSVSAVTGVTGDGLNDLGERAKNLALQFGGSATTQLEAFQTILSKFGPDLAKTPEALGAVSESVNILAKAAGLDAKASVDALSNSMLQFGVDASDPTKLAEESARFINVLAKSAEVGAAEIPQVSEAILQAGVAAKGANLSFEETNAALQALAVGGKVGSEAGIAVRNVIGLLIKQSGPGEEALNKVGLSASQLGATLTSQGLASALEQLQGGINKLGSDAEKAAFKATLFGTENASAAGILLNSVDSIKSMTEAVTGTDAALSQAAKNSDTVAARFDKFKAAIEVGLINAFQAVSPIIKSVFDNFSKLAPFLGIVAAGFVAYGIAVAASAAASALATISVGALSAAIAANPIGAAVIAVTALVAGIYALVDATSVSTEEALEAAEAEKKNIEQQIQSNKERKVTVTNTQALVREFQELANKTNRTAEEEKRLQTIQRELDKQYPDLIDQTKSFAENLKGVEEVGKRATNELSRLGKQSEELSKRLAESTKNVIFAVRNVAIDAFREAADDADIEDAGEQFINALFGAKNEQAIFEAENRFLDVQNKLVNAGKIGAQELIALDKTRTEAIKKTLAALNRNAKEVTKTIEKLPEQAPIVSVNKEATESAFKAAQDQLKDFAKEQDNALQKFENDLIKRKFTPEKIKFELALLEKQQLVEYIEYVNKLFTKTAGPDGLPITTKIKPFEKEEVKDIVDFAAGEILKAEKKLLGIKLPAELLITKVPSQEELDEQRRRRRQSLLVKAGLQIETPTGQEQTRLQKAVVGSVQTAASAIKGIDWKSIFQVPAEESKKATDEVTGNIEQGLLTYQEGIDKLSDKLVNIPSVFQKVLEELNAGFAQATDTSIKALATQAEAYDLQFGLTEEFYQALNDTAANAFAQLLTAQGEYGKTSLLLAIDILSALVPILVAEIVGKELADKSFIGLATGAALSAVLYGLLGAAKASVSGFAEGGYTGDGGKYTPAGIVHRGEFVINKENTRKYRGVLEQMNEGKFPLALAGVPVQSNDGLMTEMGAMRTELAMIRKRLNSMPNGIEGRTAVNLDVGFDTYLYQRNMRRAAVRNLRG